MKWFSDDRGNKCSDEYFGSEEAAREALASLNKCDDCINCSGCSGCSGCSVCSGCSRCSDCSDCSVCSVCSGCSGCSGCSRCSVCSRCSGCSGCSRCSGCSDLKKASPVEGEASTLPSIPVVENLHQKLYAAASAPEALNMGQWHICEKKHCRAGWVITLAGKEGRALEERFDTCLAAMKIYDASCPGFKINPARFFDENEAALADMKALAEKEITNAE